jgi:predicted CopG family antitoxin
VATKSVRIDEDLYRRIEAHKRDDETFSEAIDRLIDGWSLLGLADTLDPAEADAHREAIDASEAAGTEAVEERLERQGIDIE